MSSLFKAFVSLLLVSLFTTSAYAQNRLITRSQLENPTNGSNQSGQGVIFGWVCPASVIELVVDGSLRVQAPYGTLRTDTQSVCGGANNGFGFQVNWNVLGDGGHTLVVFADGIQIAQATFTVQTLGVPYLTGASGNYQLDNFAEKNVTITWSEPLQNFVITGWSPSGGSLPPGPNADLQAPLGLWRFVYTTISNFEDNYNLLRVETSASITGIIGTDSGGDGVAVIRGADAVDDFPYTFFLLDPGIIICQGFAFNQNGNTVSGVYVQFSVLANGDCGSVTSNLYTMSGIRMSALLSPTQPSMEPQEMLKQLEARAMPQSAVAKPNFSPLIQRANALLRQ